MRLWRNLRTAIPLTTLLLPAALSAQAEPGWNSPAVLDLVDRAIVRRAIEVVDTALLNYQADARGYVYFLLDAPELGRQNLVRTDQVAVEVYWRAPDEIRQRVVGWREQRELPITRLYYYLDRLTVVQDNYGQAIVIADGDNVRDVPHPIAESAPDFYDYRFLDSLTLRLPGVEGPVTVHEVQVKPKDDSVPAVIGSVFLEGDTGALVRMAFTFTPSSYVDPRLDYINVTLENGLWRGRFWLPHEQRLEIRREIPELDLPFGTVIRTHMRIGDYRFNQELSDLLFASPHPITFAAPADRRNFPFEQPIDAEWREEGIAQPADVKEIRREAQALLRERAMSGLRQNRPGFGSASDLFRYNRAEGPAVGFGWGIRPIGASGRLNASWAFGPGHPLAHARLTTESAWPVTLEAYANRMGDVGGSTPSSRAANTIGSLLFASDWTDPYFTTGIGAGLRLGGGSGTELNLGVQVERQRSAELASDFALFADEGEFRPVHPIDRGTHFSGSIGVRRESSSPSSGWSTGITGLVGHLAGEGESFDFGRAEAEVSADWSVSKRRATLEVEGRAGMHFGEIPRQQLYLLGGRGTVAGYDFRSFGGDRMVTARGVAAADLLHPWIRGRFLAGAGWADVGESGERAADAWGIPGSGSIRPSLGIGAGIFYDLLRVDLVRGLGTGGRTQLIVEFQRDFWDFL